MTKDAAIDVGCLLIGDFVDEGEVPTDIAFGIGEPVRPHLIASYMDDWNQRDDSKEFTVLLKDGRVAAVRGQGLKLLSVPEAEDGPIYGIVSRIANANEFVALFKSSEVVGIFLGEIRLDGEKS